MPTESESVRNKLERGAYDTKLPFGPGRESKHAYHVDQGRLIGEFKNDLLTELGLRVTNPWPAKYPPEHCTMAEDGSYVYEHPKAQTLWDIAWDERHSSGLREVIDFAETISELLT